MQKFSHRTLFAAGLTAITFGTALAPQPSWASPSDPRIKFEKDFDTLWQTLHERLVVYRPPLPAGNDATTEAAA